MESRFVPLQKEKMPALQKLRGLQGISRRQWRFAVLREIAPASHAPHSIAGAALTMLFHRLFAVALSARLMI